MSKKNGTPATVKGQVKRFVSCVSVVTNKFEDTGGRSPAGGMGYIDREHDIYVSVYRGFARVFFDRKRGYEKHVMMPHIYQQEFRIDS